MVINFAPNQNNQRS